VFGDYPLQQKGVGSRFANASPAAKATCTSPKCGDADEVLR